MTEKNIYSRKNTFLLVGADIALAEGLLGFPPSSKSSAKQERHLLEVCKKAKAVHCSVLYYLEGASSRACSASRNEKVLFFFSLLPREIFFKSSTFAICCLVHCEGVGTSAQPELAMNWADPSVGVQLYWFWASSGRTHTSRLSWMESPAIQLYSRGGRKSQAKTFELSADCDAKVLLEILLWEEMLQMQAKLVSLFGDSTAHLGMISELVIQELKVIISRVNQIRNLGFVCGGV